MTDHKTGRAPSGATIIVAVAAAVCLLPTTALAYVDPVSGSVLFQVIVAGLLGALLTVRQWWSRAVALFKGIFSRRKAS
jgi:hypothetical protein